MTRFYVAHGQLYSQRRGSFIVHLGGRSGFTVSFLVFHLLPHCGATGQRSLACTICIHLFCQDSCEVVESATISGGHVFGRS